MITVSKRLCGFKPLFKGYTQLIFIVVFVTLNCGLYLSSEPITIHGINYDATYHNASDGHRYWGAGINLAKKNEFSIPRHLLIDNLGIKMSQRLEHTKPQDAYGTTPDEVDPPLSRATPLPAIVFAIPIRIFGFQNASAWIVLIQFLLLFVMGLIVREIGSLFGANKNLLQGLVIFNPNLVGLAHHAQSDFLFAFVFTVVLLLASRILSTLSKQRYLNFIVMGLTLGCLVLARPVGYYYANLLLLGLFAVLFIHRRQREFDVKRGIICILLSFLFLQVVITPWMLRNYKTFGDFSITQKESRIMLDAQYDLFFTFNNTKDKGERKKLAMSNAYNFSLIQDDCNVDTKDDSVASNVRSTSQICETLFSVGYAWALLSEPPSQLFRALSVGWGSLFFAGGAGRLQNYLGLEVSNRLYLFNKFDGFDSLKLFLTENARQTLVFI